MAYSTNPNLPRIRREAAALVSKGWSARKVGRYLGFHHTAVRRWAYAKAYQHVKAGNTLLFVKEAQKKAPFLFNHLQTDHGPEFGKWFVHQVQIRHRHSSVRRPNNNAHLERFNRTIQEECLDRLPREVRVINRVLPKYLSFYSIERLHLGINLKTPGQVVRSY